MTQKNTPPIVVLARRASSVPGCTWEARVGDRQRLEVVLVVEPSTTAVEVALLSPSELRELLDAPPAEREAWRCAECGAVNDSSRHWCSTCSDHAGATA